MGRKPRLGSCGIIPRLGGVDYSEYLTDRPTSLKKALPCTFVLEALRGCVLHPHGNRIVVRCPMHQDSAPSLEVWQAGEWQKWGCWPCGLSGDVIDLLRALYPSLTFAQTVDLGEEAARALTASGWSGPTLQASVEWDFPRYKALLDRATELAPLADLIRAKSWQFDADFLADYYYVGGRGGEVIVPYYTRDLELTGMKHRRADGKDHLFAFPGSKLIGTFYGDHRLRSSGPVILCEGESDVWTAAWTAPDFSVLGLPAGAGTMPFRCAEFSGREVHLCLDGDAAGRAGARRWAEELAAAGADVRLWDLPEGQDVTSLGGPLWLL